MVVKPDLDLLVIDLEKWIKTQPHLPQTIEKCVLRRFLYSMFGDMNEAKRLLELNYTMRNKYSHIFLDRDPMDESSQQLLQVADLLPLPGLTPQKNKLLFYRLIDHDANKFNFVAGVKVFFMVADCRFATDSDQADGEIPVFDMAGFSLRHLAKTSFNALRIYMKFVQEAHPVRLKEIHVLNCPGYLDKVIAIIKPFIRSEVFKLIHFHLPNAETPFEYFPRDMLPDEFGGKAGKSSDLKAHWMNILKEKRNYLMNASYWKIDKSRKSIDDSMTSSTTTTTTTDSSIDISKDLKNLEID